jgi:cytochrome c biogenesis protein CcdA
MLETFTPAVCGSRKRQMIAQGLFAAAAVATAAALGLVLGFAGDLLGAERAVLAAAVLALVAAGREAGLLRLPLPQARRQVPERWRFELPLPVWATGYGAGLGAGFFTFHPVSTFWVACAGALALASPVSAALCLSLYGAGRALMVVWPRRRADDPTAAVERLVGRRGALLRANALALLGCGLLLAAAPAAGGATLVARDAYDPTFQAGGLAYATQNGRVVVRRPGADLVIQGASQPALHRNRLAYVDSGGIRIVRRSDGQTLAYFRNSRASQPALDWPLLAFIRRGTDAKRVVTRNMVTGTTRVHGSVKLRDAIGRPALGHGRLAWHTATRRESRIYVKNLGGARRVYARSRVALLMNPSLHGRKIAFAQARFGRSRLKLGSVRGGPRRTLETIRSRTRSYWTTTMAGGVVYSTRWTLGSGRADVFRTTF